MSYFYFFLWNTFKLKLIFLKNWKKTIFRTEGQDSGFFSDHIENYFRMTEINTIIKLFRTD